MSCPRCQTFDPKSHKLFFNYDCELEVQKILSNLKADKDAICNAFKLELQVKNETIKMLIAQSNQEKESFKQVQEAYDKAHIKNTQYKVNLETAFKKMQQLNMAMANQSANDMIKYDTEKKELENRLNIKENEFRTVAMSMQEKCQAMAAHITSLQAAMEAMQIKITELEQTKEELNLKNAELENFIRHLTNKETVMWDKAIPEPVAWNKATPEIGIWNKATPETGIWNKATPEPATLNKPNTLIAEPTIMENPKENPNNYENIETESTEEEFNHMQIKNTENVIIIKHFYVDLEPNRYKSAIIEMAKLMKFKIHEDDILMAKIIRKPSPRDSLQSLKTICVEFADLDIKNTFIDCRGALKKYQETADLIIFSYKSLETQVLLRYATCLRSHNYNVYCRNDKVLVCKPQQSAFRVNSVKHVQHLLREIEAKSRSKKNTTTAASKNLLK